MLRRGWIIFVGLCLCLGLSESAHAELAPRVTPLDTQSDGVYGRFDGDLDFGLGVGARIDAAHAQFAMRATVHYFSMAGIYASYADGFEADQGPRHLTSVGLDLRPAFVPRWSLGLEVGPQWLDLMVDSISLSLGAYWAGPAEATAPVPAGAPRKFGDLRGLETGLGMGVPLLGEAAGPWFDARGTLSFADHARGTQPTASAALMLSLSWHALWTSPLAKNAP